MFACAESCTGGLLAREMTALAGASDVFWGGLVTYSDEAKRRWLGVPEALLAAHGAVSGPVAEAMVLGLLDRSGASLGVSITGIAGPGGGSPGKPVGTVWFGVGAIRGGEGRAVAVLHRFSGFRSQIQRESARWARVLARFWWETEMDLDSLRSLLDNTKEPLFEASQTPVPFLPNPF